MKLGNLLRALTRYEPSLASYRRASELAPNDAEITFVRATAEHDFGNLAVAQELYAKVVQLKSGNVLAIEEDDDLQGALAGLQDLKKGRPSPWNYMVSNSQGNILRPPRRDFKLSKGQSKKKDKRRRRH